MARQLLITACLLTLLGLLGCADERGNLVSGDVRTPNGSSGQNNGNVPPERETEFEFAQPAVVGPDVFVANESLNSIAVIDSRSLAIRTIPVGFNPTRVVGPTEAAPDARVWVLNEGSSTVSIVDPQTSRVVNAKVLRRANAIAASPDGTWALAWLDPAGFEDDGASTSGTTLDFSAATLVFADGTAHDLAIGYRVERVVFTDDRALVLTDDGVSVVRPAEITGDALVPPVAVLPAALQADDELDREVVLDPAGDWAVARVRTASALFLTELTTGAQWAASLPAPLSDLDWVPGAIPRILGIAREANLIVLATVPDGLIALSDVEPTPGDDMGADVGSDMGPDMNGDMSLPDAGDIGTPDAGDVDAGPPPMATMPVDGVWYLPLDQPGLGAAQVAPNAANALLFSTIGEERRAVLLDLESLEQRGFSFEKGVRGAIANDLGTRFIVLHTRVPGAIPDGAAPSDPEVIARSWGLSIVDVESAATRLVLTDREPGEATLWPGEPERLYMIFAESAGDGPSLRDVLRIDLQSFSTDTFRVPSVPEGIGRIDDAGRIFVNQRHPQGRITFVDVATDRRQTVTGYQLNAGID